MVTSIAYQKKSIIFGLLTLVLTGVVIYSWEALSTYKTMASFNEVFEPSATTEQISRVEIAQVDKVGKGGVESLLDNASEELEIIYDALQTQTKAAESRLQMMFYIICGLALLVLFSAIYLLFLRKSSNK
ncbi:hypothetical protein FMN52_19175 [Marinobacter sp. BW6]|uniref:hypothetical protein n=1 Tax=Marinobacter sp. BW6 TaxID=2592624 RepID=UPI0011DEF5A5|nr:hypothetical protein [Marinobacter sp. BW6]TYC53240.1 hypothetical protein FMN52_19175 [Marinobacter sp. BW6]